MTDCLNDEISEAGRQWECDHPEGGISAEEGVAMAQYACEGRLFAGPAVPLACLREPGVSGGIGGRQAVRHGGNGSRVVAMAPATALRVGEHMIVIEELEDEEHTAEIELAVRGLTCICPVNGLTDTFDIAVRYRPMRGRVLELGAFRALLECYAGARIAHEALTVNILRVIVEQINPESLEVLTTWAPVEGVECIVRVVA